MLQVDADKVLVADAAYDFPLEHLPKPCKVVLRYVGKADQTPHIVTRAEVANIRKHGLVWAPIWTPTNTVFSDQLGAQAGNGMVAALAGYRLLGPEPVFLDIEQHVYAADPHGCMAGVEHWQRVMHNHGHARAYAYLPAAAEAQWVADWVGTAPHHFAPGVIGVQYTGSGPAHGEYDLSVFARHVFQPLLDAAGGKTVQPLTDRQWTVEQLDALQHNLAKLIRAESADIQAAAITAAHGNVQALAEAIVTKLGPGLAGDLADVLARRLAR